MPKETKDLSIITAKKADIDRSGIKTVSVAGLEFKVENLVNVPTLKHETGEAVAFTITQPINEQPTYRDMEAMIDGVKTTVKQEVVINVGRVRDLVTGEDFNYVYNAMSADNLRSAYPDNSYVGKHFAIYKGDRVPGKQYKETQVVEINPDFDAIQKARDAASA